ncbi:hypothetical protein [Chromobacterium piscinae]|uniref:hypothetical protein n=1 Tax=Chromobacterium piscinae TaxID=686831 RepID=UPI00366CB300
MNAFAEGDRERRPPTVPAMWRRQWEQVIPVFGYPSQVRRIITRPRRLKACTCNCARSSKPGPCPERRGCQQAALPCLAQD